MRAIDLHKVDPSSNSDGHLGLGLEFGALETNVYTPKVGNVATVAVWDFSNEGAGRHLCVVVKSRFI